MTPVQSNPNPAWTRLRAGVACAVFGLAFLVGCSTQTKQKWLTFFFDGVPQPGAHTNAPAQPLGAQSVPTNAVAEAAAQPVKAKLFIHPPYAKRECSVCHQSEFSQKMNGKPGEVCFTCHTDFLTKAKVKHQPVENGECASCHDPHQADNTNLLVRVGAKLCTECHDDIQQQLAKAKVKHQPAENGECVSCHSPHQSDNKKLLVKPDGKLCAECHDDLQKQIASAKSRHPPAADGDCAACHKPHAAEQSHLLAKSVPALCAECHEETDLQKVKQHQSAADQSACLSCHDPHQSDRQHLLKAEAKASPRPPGK